MPPSTLPTTGHPEPAGRGAERPKAFPASRVLCCLLLILLFRPAAAAVKVQEFTLRRHNADCQNLLQEKRSLGYDVAPAQSLADQARRTGLSGDLAGSLRLFLQAEARLRECDFPLTRRPDMPTIQGLPAGPSPAGRGGALTAGALTLELTADGLLDGLRLGERTISHAGCAGGFYILDPASSKTDLFSGKVEPQAGGLRFQAVSEASRARLEVLLAERDGSLILEGTLTNLDGQDRGALLCWKLPIDPAGLRWWDDADLSLPIPEAPAILQNSSYAGFLGSSPRLISIYPLACLSGPAGGLALGIPMDLPSVFRLNYDTRDRTLNLYYEFGLSPQTVKFPDQARFRILLYPLADPAWGFRSAWESYYRLLPHLFADRVRLRGLWGETEAAGLLGETYKELGYAFLQGDNQSAQQGKKLGIYSMRFNWPWGFFLHAEDFSSLTPAQARQRLAASGAEGDLRSIDRLLYGRASEPDVIRAARDSAIHGPGGEYVIEPDGDYRGVRVAVNPDPEIELEGSRLNTSRVAFEGAIRPSVEEVYQAQGQPLWGLFFDIAGPLLNCENFRAEHFRFADFPLTYDYAQKRPVLFGLSSACEYLAWIGEWAHRQGGIIGLNTSPYPFNLVFLAAFSDMAGDEHLPGRREMNLRRALAGGKYVGFAAFESWEELLRNGLFYGVFPAKKLLGGRTEVSPIVEAEPLLRRYVPLIKAVEAAGWQPVTRARTGDREVLVERFGSADRGPFFFTLWNEAAAARAVSLSLEEGELGAAGRTLRATDLLSGRELPCTAGRISLTLGPGEVTALRLE